MPRIREYRSNVDSIATPDITGRRARPDQFGGGNEDAGRSVMSAAQTLYHVAEEQEVTNVHTLTAKARADWTVALQERAAQATPGDTTLAQKFTDDLSGYFDTLSAGINTVAGRRAFDRQSAEVKSHLIEKAGIYQAHAASVNATQNYIGAVDNWRNTLLNDPAQFDSVLAQATDTLNDANSLYGRIPAEQRIKLERQTRGEIALSAVQGIIRRNPDLAAEQLRNGAWDQWLDADKKYTLERGADIAIRAKEVEQERKIREADRAERKAQQATEDKFISKLFGPDGTLSTQDVINSNLTPEHKLRWIGLIDRSNRPDPVAEVSRATTVRILEDMRRGENDPYRISDLNPAYDAFMRGELTRSDFDWIAKQFNEMRTPDGEKLTQSQRRFLDGVKSQIYKPNPMVGDLDGDGAQKFYEFSFYVDHKIQEYRKAGKNPYDLFDPSKPDYLGKPEALAPFQRTLAESMKSLAEKLNRRPVESVAPRQPSGTTTPQNPNESVNLPRPDDTVISRQPGESPDHYLDRAARYASVLNLIENNATRRATAKGFDLPIYQVHGIWLYEDGSEVKELNDDNEDANKGRAKIYELFKQHGLDKAGHQITGNNPGIGSPAPQELMKVFGQARIAPFIDDKGNRVPEKTFIGKMLR